MFCILKLLNYKTEFIWWLTSLIVYLKRKVKASKNDLEKPSTSSKTVETPDVSTNVSVSSKSVIVPPVPYSDSSLENILW